MTIPPTAFDRGLARSALARQPFDVVVVGGGATGAGVALDAAGRGLRTALVEAQDWASGTSSRSSKLIHGGLRYLQKRELRLVYESLAERQRLLANASHLVKPMAFLIPSFNHRERRSSIDRAVGSALWLYDLTGGLRIGRRHRHISSEQAAAHFPALRRQGLAGAFVYWDARVDDARLVLAIVRTAVLDHGAVALSYAPVTGLLEDDGRVAGVRLALEGGSLEVPAPVVVNATGVWADQVAGWAPSGPAQGGGAGSPGLRPAKGVHLSFPAECLPCDMAVVLPAPGGRSVFVVPWGQQVYVGTTDTEYSGPLHDHMVTADDVTYLLDAVNTIVTPPVRRADVTGVWSGLRPLLADGAPPGASTSDLSRRHLVSVSPAGLVTVTGGKLTTYRKMAADAVDQVVALLGRGRRSSPTRSMRLRGSTGAAELVRSGRAVRLGLDTATLEHLVARYGSEASTVAGLLTSRPDLAGPLVDGLDYLAVEAIYAARYEMAHTLTDVLARRTRALLRDRLATARAAPRVAELLAPEMGWDRAEAARQVATLCHEIQRQEDCAGLGAAAGGLGAAAGGLGAAAGGLGAGGARGHRSGS